MPSHIHIIIQHLECKLPGILRDLKSFTAKEILKNINESGESRRDWLLHLFQYYAKKTKQNKQFMIWQKTNHPIELSDNDIYDQKAAYIQINPVAAGYVTDELAWKYSSAGYDSPLKIEDGLLAGRPD